MALLPTNELDLSANARALPYAQRASIIEQYPEHELRAHLKRLLEHMIPNSVVETTHGQNERGKDLVVVIDEPLGRRVLAFVVKTGKIGSRAAGTVDEIISQVQQALTHPAKLTHFAEPLDVRQVYVIVAGNITEGARERINREIKGVIQNVWDMAKVVEAFTDYYPEVFFEAECLDFLQQKIVHLETHHTFARVAKDKTLSEWFVEPIVATYASVEALSSDPAQVIQQLRRLPFMKLRTLLAQNKKVLLLGPPGSGKSATAAKIAVDMMKDAYKHVTKGHPKDPVDVPVLLTSSEILKFEDCSDLMTDYFRGVSHPSHFRPAILMIDGLDEVPAQLRPKVLQKAIAFSSGLDCSLVVTSRLIEAVRSPVKGFERVEVMQFEFNQAIRLFDRIVPEGWLRNTLKEGLQAIRWQIDMTPLSLMLLIQVVEEYREIPASITELYDRFFDQVLGRFDKDKGIQVLFDHTVKKFFLAELTYKEYFLKGRMSIPRYEFHAFVKEYAAQYQWDAQSFGRFIEEIDRSGLLRVGDDVEFQHRSFLDYFVALHISRRRDKIEGLEDFLVNTYFHDLWTEVPFFYVGLNREVDDSLMKKILGFGDDSLDANILKLLSGRLLQAGWHSPYQVKEDGIRLAIEKAPTLETQFRDLLQAGKATIPLIVSDFFLFTLADMAFASTFLFEATKRLADELLASPSYASIRKALLLISAMRTRLDSDMLKDCTQKALGAMGHLKGLGAENESRLLIDLMIVSNDVPEVRSSLQKRLRRLLKRHPDIGRRLLP